MNAATKIAWITAFVVLFQTFCLAVPLYVIRPFVPQDPQALSLALELRRLAPIVSVACAGLIVAATLFVWQKCSHPIRLILVTFLGITLIESWAARINIFEVMFHPYSAGGFVAAGDAMVDKSDKVLAVTFGSESHAYPVRLMGYHHIVNDMVGSVPIAVTYCTLCHTGLVWRRQLDGRTLRFRLAGINNGNALLQDEETGSVWQQSTGEAIFGELKGRHLEVFPSDELTFSLWLTEHPHGQVLKPDPTYVTHYDAKEWEKHVEATHTVVDTGQTGIGPHSLMLGVTVAGQSKAYPMDALRPAKIVRDEIGGMPVLLLVGPDGVSVRVFQITAAEHRGMTFVGEGSLVTDGETGSIWNFQGCAVAGKLAGQCLPELESHLDYWFDWFNHHPGTLVFRK